MSCKFLHLSTFEEIEQKYLTRFPKYNFRQPPAFVNYNNAQYLLGGSSPADTFKHDFSFIWQPIVVVFSEIKLVIKINSKLIVI